MVLTGSVTSNNPVTSTNAPFPLMKLPPELRMNIYRQYFSATPRISVKSRITTLGSVFCLLHANSQVRLETAPIFYNELLGSADSIAPRCWGLDTRDGRGSKLVKRLNAITQSVAVYGTDIELAFACEVSGDCKIELECQFVDDLLEHIGAQIPGFVHRSPTKELNYKQWRDLKPPFNFIDASSGFSTTYRIRALSKWVYYERFILKGPLAKVDWTGLRQERSIVQFRRLI